jgi:hypothetical protein
MSSVIYFAPFLGFTIPSVMGVELADGDGDGVGDGDGLKDGVGVGLIIPPILPFPPVPGEGDGFVPGVIDGDGLPMPFPGDGDAVGEPDGPKGSINAPSCGMGTSTTFDLSPTMDVSVLIGMT